MWLPKEELGGLLVHVPLVFDIVEEQGRSREGELFHLGPAAKHVAASGETISARITPMTTGWHIGWDFAPQVPGHEGAVTRTSYGASLRKIKSRLGVGASGHAAFDEQFQVLWPKQIDRLQWLDRTLAELLVNDVKGCRFEHADLVNVRVQPGSVLSVACSIEKNADAVAQSYRVAHRLRARWVPLLEAP